MNAFGFWYMQSESDPRWNCMGSLVSQNVGFSMPPEMRAKFDELKEKHGSPPTDLDWNVTTGEKQ